jgi:hypothetical protein
MQNFEFLRQPLLGELAMSRKREERKRKNDIYSGHLRLCQQPRAALALRSDQFQLKLFQRAGSLRSKVLSLRSTSKFWDSQKCVTFKFVVPRCIFDIPKFGIQNKCLNGVADRDPLFFVRNYKLLLHESIK